MLATGDSDFGPVFRRLREMGKGVIGIGPYSVLSKSVSLSCHEYIFTDAPKKKGKAGKAWAEQFDGSSYGCAAAGVTHPPHLRGGFRIRQQLPAPADGAAPSGMSLSPPRRVDAADEPCGRQRKAPLLIEAAHQPEAAPEKQAASKGGGVNGAGAAGSGASVDRVAGRSGFQAAGEGCSSGAAAPGRTAQGVGAGVVGDKVTDAVAEATRAPGNAGGTGEQRVPHRVPKGSSLLLTPGQLLVPHMITAGSRTADHPDSTVSRASSRAPAPSTSSCPGARGRVDAGARCNVGAGSHNPSSGHHASGARSRGRTDGGLGALSAIHPTEKLYRHLLALDSTSESGMGSLACDWGYGLSEVTLAQGLVSLATACSGQRDSAHSRAVEALVGATRLKTSTRVPPTASALGGGAAVSPGALSREDACRVATLLQRCGFLTWLPEEHQWLVTVPADVEVLRRRRDDILLEELRTRCQEAGVPFEPALASNFLWAKRT